VAIDLTRRIFWVGVAGDTPRLMCFFMGAGESATPISTINVPVTPESIAL
jgi:hypothetical protein